MDQNERCTFFFQVPLGLEGLALKELTLKFPGLFPHTPLTHPQEEVGGFTLELPLKCGLTLNYWLKIPNRILLRFAHFKCRDIPKLFNKVSKLKWAPFFAGQEFSIDVSAKKSRLFDERKIKKCLSDALDKYAKAQAPKEESRQRAACYSHWRLLARFEEDWCTLSIDTSGERLGLRGYKKKIGRAPLRENLASALYLFTALSFKENNSHQGLNSFTRPLTLVDPFCGSGTLLLEASLFFEPNLFRSYSFEFFPHSKKFNVSKPTSFHLERELFLLASDNEEERINDTRENFKEAHLKTVHHHIQRGDLTDKSFQKKLALEIFSSKKYSTIRPWLITNPPYGKRVDQTFTAKELLKVFQSWGHFERIGLLLPRDQLTSLDLIENDIPGINSLGNLDFIHGGDKVRFALFNLEIN